MDSSLGKTSIAGLKRKGDPAKRFRRRRRKTMRGDLICPRSQS